MTGSHESAGGVRGLVDRLFRRQSGRLVATLTRSFGPAHLDLAQEVVQEALIRALKRWPYGGVPDDPAGWLYRVAHNLALDRLRRERSFRGKEASIRQTLFPGGGIGPAAPTHLGGELGDDQLRLIFLCCHPELPRDGRVALTLRTVGGFSAREIARGFLAREATVAQRLVRAQRLIRERKLPFVVPGGAELPERLDAVLEAIYLMFNEGYAAHDGADLVRDDVCAEAVRLARCLAAEPATATPTVHALASLLCFQASRLPARVDARGNLVLLAEQDRDRWDRRLVALGFCHLERAATGTVETVYHLQAAIASRHAAAGDDATTDWPGILAAYDRLLDVNPTPVVALNRAVAVDRVRGPEAGLQALEAIGEHPALTGYYLLPATRADLLARLGRTEEARREYRRALGCACTEPERRFLMHRLNRL